MNLEQITSTIDHTNIDPQATEEDILKTCREAQKYDFRSVCINPEWVKLVSQELKGTSIKTVVLIDPPMGQSSHEKRVEMVKKSKQDGADEIDIVMNIVDLKYERYQKVKEDLEEICDIAPTKVIIGSGFLTDQEIEKASQIVKESGAICVKTATSKDPLEHRELEEKARHLELMRKGAPGLEIKAAGKIRAYQDWKMMVDAGADIIGTSTGVQIVEDFKSSSN